MKSFIKILFIAIILCSTTQYSKSENITVKIYGTGGTTIVSNPDGTTTATVCPEPHTTNVCCEIEVPAGAIFDGQVSPNTNITITTNDGTVLTGSFNGCVNGDGNITSLNGLILTIQ